MTEPRYLYSEMVPRVASAPDLHAIPPRLLRAANRYADLVEVFNGMVTKIRDAPTVTANLADLDKPNPPLGVNVPQLSWPEAYELRLLVSEILHHLRAAADHLIYNIAWLDSGAEQRRTQFPVFKVETEFRSRSLQMLSGVNASHRQWIEDVQPFNGVTWTESLADLSNQA
jgi:hypothetical protein